MFDIETTGFSPKKNKIIEIGAVKVVDGRITDKFSSFVNPDVPIPFDIEKLTGINDSMVHEDFMIGSADLSIDAHTRDGRTVPIFRDGNWAF